MHSSENSEYLKPDYFGVIVCSFSNAWSLLAIIPVAGRENCGRFRGCSPLTAAKLASLFDFSPTFFLSKSFVEKELMADQGCSFSSLQVSA